MQENKVLFARDHYIIILILKFKYDDNVVI